MSNTFKIIILIIVLFALGFIIVRNKKPAPVNIDQSLEQGGPGGERAEAGINIDTEAEFSNNN